MKKHLFHQLFQVFIFTILLLFIAVTYSQSPVPDIKINNSDGPLSLNSATDNVSLSVQLDTNGRTDAADWFIATSTPFGAFFYTPNGWMDLIEPLAQVPLLPLPNIQLMNFPASALPSGNYAFYFAVDTEMDGLLSLQQLYFDVAEFTVQKYPYKQNFIDATKGGSFSVTNSRGDVITLSIPPLALPKSTTITLTAVDISQNSPIKKNIFPGVRIEPEGLMLRKPARLRVQLAEEGVNTEKALLFYQKQSDFVIPLGEHVAMGALLEGEIYHFSDFICGEPDEDEVTEQSNKATNLDSDDPLNWQSVAERAKGVLGWAEYCMLFGGCDSTYLIDAARNIAEQKVRDFLNLPIPKEPSDAYLDALLNYEEMLEVIGGDQALRDALAERLKNLKGGPAMFELEWWDWGITSNEVDYSAKPKNRIPFRVDVHKNSRLITGGGTLIYDKTYPCGYEQDCTCSLHSTIPFQVTGSLNSTAGTELDAYGDVYLKVDTRQGYWYTVEIRVCPGRNASLRETNTTGSDHYWLFPVKDGTGPFNTTSTPILHIIKWEQWMKDRIIEIDD